MADTGRRIVDAAVQLHRTVGPRLTSVTEIAKRAGVQRLTVYNHFPSEAELIAAVQDQWLTRHPYPDFGALTAIDKRGARLRAGLDALYRWYEETEPMTANIVRDAPAMEGFMAVREAAEARMRRLLEILLPGWDERERVRASLAAVLDFGTWQMLCRRSSFDRAKAVALAVDWVKAA